ncbi:serine/threonine-protein kinase N2-like [Diadema antillarum]|uniref:serine/threonine-protein kinase N2-like n=1 Tax=Diadema antillarum TaxID=105358 RepID=UPI003A8A1DDC
MAADSSAVLAQPHGDTLGNYVEQQYGSNEFLDLSDASIQYRLEQMKDQIRKEIRKELKIKEGAENMRKVTTDKKSLANVNNMVKQANARLQELQQELNELNARIVVNTDNTGPSPGSTRARAMAITDGKLLPAVLSSGGTGQGFLVLSNRMT